MKSMTSISNKARQRTKLLSKISSNEMLSQSICKARLRIVQLELMEQRMKQSRKMPMRATIQAGGLVSLASVASSDIEGKEATCLRKRTKANLQKSSSSICRSTTRISRPNLEKKDISVTISFLIKFILAISITATRG